MGGGSKGHWRFTKIALVPKLIRGMSETPTTTTSQKVLQYTFNLHCNTPPICIAVPSVPLSTQEREILQYSSHFYHSTPPICIPIRLPFVLQYFWESLGGCGHRVVPKLSLGACSLLVRFLCACLAHLAAARL